MGLIPHLTMKQLISLEFAPYAFTGLIDDRVIFCAGVSEYWPGRGEGWALLTEESRHHMLVITRMIKRFLEICPTRRIEASVEVNFKEGHRWAKMLGFELEASRLRAYLPDGQDCSLYARVR